MKIQTQLKWVKMWSDDMELYSHMVIEIIILNTEV